MALKIKTNSTRLCALLISGAVGFALSGCEAGEKSAAEEQRAKLPPVSVTAPELAKAYDDNEAAAQQIYGNKPLLVTGIVTGITLDFADDPVVEMRGLNEFLDVQLSLADESKDRAASVKKGTEMTLRCEGVGEVMGTPMVKECNFVETEGKAANKS